MAKNSKSRRFTQTNTDTIKKHDERFPYRTTLARTTSDRNHPF